VNVARARVLAFVVSATCAGMAGAMLAIITALVAPGDFTITLSIALLTGAVIGGLGTLFGAIWGSLVIVLVPTYATDVATSHGLSASVASNIPVAAYGVVLILVMLIFPQGIQGAVRWVLRLFGFYPGGGVHPGGKVYPGGRPPGAPRLRLNGAPAASGPRDLANAGGGCPEHDEKDEKNQKDEKDHEKEGTQ
jgi:hypothetical protein